MKIVRTCNTQTDFVKLTAKLDAELNQRYGLAQSTYDKHNKIDSINTAVVAYLNEKPVACGCFKRIDSQIIEIKRMYVVDAFRRRGFSVLVLNALEKWATELGFLNAILETGKGQPEAIELYQKCGYTVIDNYGPYKDLENSVCMEKLLSPQVQNNKI
jgi:GNAT superfamily N-acetyltransferase